MLNANNRRLNPRENEETQIPRPLGTPGKLAPEVLEVLVSTTTEHTETKRTNKTYRIPKLAPSKITSTTKNTCANIPFGWVIYSYQHFFH